MLKTLFGAIIGIGLTSAVAHASDSLVLSGSNPIAGQLSIPSVQLGSTIYRDVVVGVTVNKIVSVGGSAAAPANPLLGTWVFICPAATCGAQYSVILTFNSNNTFSGTETVMDGSFTSTGTGTVTGTYTGPGSTIVTVAGVCKSIGNTQVTGCDSAGTMRSYKVTIFGSGAGSVATFVGSNGTLLLYKITN